MPGVLIIAEVSGEELTPTLVELAVEGRRLADEMGQSLTALLMGKVNEGAASGLGEYGVEQALVAEHEAPVPPAAEWLLAAAEAGANQVQPEVILLTHGGAGRDVAPSLAFRLGAGIVSDCTKLTVADGALVATKPVYGGSALSEQAITSTPKVATLRPRAFAPGEPVAGKQAPVERVAVPATEGRLQVLEQVRTDVGQGPRLKDAKIVVAGGRGLGGPENWKYVEELADVLGGAVGASRAVTDAGWVAPAHQVGLTGATIAPDLYITIGISGAVQHVAGISGARNVVAINKDGDANIFKFARYGVVGDWKQILPAFTQRLKELRG